MKHFPHFLGRVRTELYLIALIVWLLYINFVITKKKYLENFFCSHNIFGTKIIKKNPSEIGDMIFLKTIDSHFINSTSSWYYSQVKRRQLIATFNSFQEFLSVDFHAKNVNANFLTWKSVLKQKSEICQKSKILVKNLKFGQKSKIWSKIQNLVKNPKFDQKW